MTPREKNLLVLLCGTLFLILNVVAYNKFYTPKMKAAELSKHRSTQELARAQTVLGQSDAWKKTVSWLENNKDKATTYAEAQTKLQSVMRKQADARGLTTRGEDILPHIEGPSYTRVRVKYKLNGMEQQVQQWLMSIHQPRQFQVITKLTIKPQTNDLTRVDVEVEVEKFIRLADPNNSGNITS